MSIYISKNAINNIPLVEKSLANEGNGGKLQSLLLSRNHQLVGIAKNDTSYSPLKIGMENEAVRLIKVALNFINEQNDIYPGYTITTLDVNSYKFDANLKNAIVEYQNWSGIAPAGTIDSKTLLSIDSKFLGDELFDAERKKYIGKASNKEFSFKQKQSLVNNKYEYSISFSEGDEMIKIETDTILKGKIIKKGSINNNESLRIKPSSKSKKVILNDPKAKKIAEKHGFDNQNFTFIIKPIDTKIEFNSVNGPIDTFVLDYNLEEANTPPLLFDDEDAKLHKITDGDTPSKIVLDNYYGGGGYPIKDPYNKNVIFTLPERTPFPAAKRSEDARFQFYLNLLYYYNSEDKGGNLKEWGLTKDNSYQRYPVNHLDDVNIFDNKYDAGNPHTGLPNYYRFLKKMEALNPTSKIVFDNAGNATSFKTVTGKNIRIPSRKFADSMYYFLNFRHNEMLVPVVVPPSNPGGESTSIMSYVVDQALETIINTVTNAIDSVTSVATEVKSDAIALYHEAAEFFRKVYDFAINVLTNWWPRGAGGTIAVGGSITWGIPIKTEGNIEKSLYRKMSKENELTIVYSTQLTVGVGADVASGVSLGLYTGGHGKSKKTLGLNVGAGVEGKYSTIVASEYEFPVRKDETALLTMIINVFGGTLVNATADVLEYLDVINLNPRQYLTKMEVALEQSTNGWAAAQLGVDNGNGISGVNKEEGSEQDKSKSYGSIDNIFSKLPGIGAQANGDFTGGVAFSYEVDYGTNPFTTNHEGRVFETIDIDTKLYLQVQLGFDLMGKFFQKLFVNQLPGSDFVSTIFDSLEFDKGLMLGVNYHLKRIDAADSLGAGDFDFKGTNVIVDTISGDAIRYNTSGQKVIKQISLYFGTFTGDVDTLCEPGTEIKFNINAGTIYQMWKQGANYDYNFENVFSLFRSIEYHKKVGAFNFDTGKTKNIKIKTPDNNLSEQAVSAHRKGNQNNTEVQLVSRMLEQSLKLSKENVFLSGGLALDIKMEMEINLLAKVFKYYIKKLNYKYLTFSTLTAQNKFEKKLEDIKLQIHKKIKEKAISDALVSGNTTESQVIEALGEDYYDKLFDDNPNGIYPNTPYNTFGLNAVIDKDYININPPDDYLIALKRFIKGINPYNRYMNNKKPTPKEDLDYGITKIIDYFNFIGNLAHLEITLEAKAGVSFGGNLKAGEGLTAGVALDALAEINYQGKLYENGALTDLEINDPLRAIFQEIHKALALPNTNKRIGVKTILEVL